jgi:hypothetical protein
VIELRISTAAALSIVEQADYDRQTLDLELVHRRELAVDQAVNFSLPRSEWPMTFNNSNPLILNLDKIA